MEYWTLIAEIAICVVFGAMIREGLRRKSEALTAVSLWSLIATGVFLLIDISTDRRERLTRSLETPVDWAERDRALDRLTEEWVHSVRNSPGDMIITCFPFEPPPADATAPEN